MRVMIAEDAAVLREGLTRLLTDRGHEVSAAVGDADALLAAVSDDQPDVVIADIRMPPSHTDEGLRAAEAIRRDFPSVGVLVFSQYIETRYTSRLLESGAGGVGYLLKDRVANVAQFVDAVRRVADGGTAMDPEVVSQLLARNAGNEPMHRLTPREREVLGLMAEGRSNAAIATKLFVTDKAIAKHTNNIFAKLDLPPSSDDNRRVLAVLAYLNA
jgi:DNA-binding NarL/FixJ family response regulator